MLAKQVLNLPIYHHVVLHELSVVHHRRVWQSNKLKKKNHLQSPRSSLTKNVNRKTKEILWHYY